MLRELEHKHPLLDLRFDGTCAWVLIRWTVAMQLARLPLSAPGAQISRRQRLGFAMRDVFGWLRAGERRVVVQTYSSALLESEGDRYKDIWFDDLLQRLPARLKVEQLNSAQYLERRERALVASDMTTALIDLMTSLLYRTQRPKAAGAVARDLHSMLSGELQDAAPSTHGIETALGLFYWRKRVWSRLLRRAGARMVLTADPGDYSLVAAAREAQITAIEMQHGIVDRYNPAYSWSASALPHRPDMPVPDVLFLHGEHWRTELAAPGFWQERLKVVGNPRVDLYRGRHAVDSTRSRRRVVFTSQGIAPDATAQVLQRALSAAGDDIDFIVRLHPVYDDQGGDAWSVLGMDPRVQIIPGNREPSTLKLLADADLHVSISSATHYDAIALGVPTVVLALAGHETVMPLVEQGHASLAADAGSLAALLCRPAIARVDAAVSEYYCRSGAVNNMLHELAALDSVREAA
jgi:hypothetical protein